VVCIGSRSRWCRQREGRRQSEDGIKGKLDECGSIILPRNKIIQFIHFGSLSGDRIPV
jgi:hypothetical protein